jgi:hypothetical protein
LMVQLTSIDILLETTAVTRGASRRI